MSDLPIEVKLVARTRQCRTCKWFWGATPPYGKFPMFDWNEDFPKEIRNQNQTTKRLQGKAAMKGEAVGLGKVDPGIMHGCRKAPIMTIGINPNMTAYYASYDGARWSYPSFSKDARYAYYYRHHNVYQESLDPDFIRENVKDGTEIVAEQDGWLLSADRSSDHRWVLLTIRYSGEEKPRKIEIAWTADLPFVVLVDTRRKTKPNDPHFTAGQIIGGKIQGLTDDCVQIYENTTSYYQRYVCVLDRFKRRAGEPLASADLSISEDVAQHDMIACASPGWSNKYDIPRERITQNCVIDNTFLISQLVQSKPAVIVIVGRSSLEMFAQALSTYLTDLDYQHDVARPDGTTEQAVKETFQLLKETVEREHFLHIKIDDFELKSRIVVSPHFSYWENFRNHSRLSASAWNAFQEDFPEDARILEEKKRRQPNAWNGTVPILLDSPNDDIRDDLSASAWNVLMAYYYDPIDMLADVLLQELDAGRIAYDDSIKRLRRTEGGCRFCVNDLWKFPEGCPYGKPDEASPRPGELEGIVRKVARRGQEVPATDGT